jgi:hypothetical protein
LIDIDSWKVLVVGYNPHGPERLNASFVLDLSPENKACKSFPDYPIMPKKLAASFDANGNPIFCGNSPACYRYFKHLFKFLLF